MKHPGPETTLQPTPSSSSAAEVLQDDDPPVFEFNDNQGAPVNTCSFEASLYPFMDIWLTMKQVTNFQNSGREVNMTNSKEVDESSRCYSLEYSGALISVTPVPSATEIFKAFNLLDWENQRLFLPGACQVIATDGSHSLNVMR